MSALIARPILLSGARTLSGDDEAGVADGPMTGHQRREAFIAVSDSLPHP